MEIKKKLFFNVFKFFFILPFPCWCLTIWLMVQITTKRGLSLFFLETIIMKPAVRIIECYWIALYTCWYPLFLNDKSHLHIFLILSESACIKVPQNFQESFSYSWKKGFVVTWKYTWPSYTPVLLAKYLWLCLMFLSLQ